MYLSIHLPIHAFKFQAVFLHRQKGIGALRDIMGWCSANVKDDHFRLVEFNLSSLISVLLVFFKHDFAKNNEIFLL